MKAQEPRPGATAAEAAGWSAAAAVSRPGREQIRYLLDQRDVLDRLHKRFDNLGVRQQQGHYFEWLHELSFNLDAIRQSSDQRLLVTTWLGRPHAPADLELVDGAGRVLAGVQAKVVGDGAARLSREAGIVAPKYDGLALLMPSDHVQPTDALLSRRLAMPEGPLHARYAEVLERLTDHIESGRVSSDPVSSADLAEATTNPDDFLAGLVRDTALTHAMHASIAAGGTAAVTSLAGSVAGDAIRHRDFRHVAWADAAVKAARVGGAAVAVAAMSSVTTTAAEISLGAGSTSVLANATDADLATAMARSVLTVAGAAHGLATGRLSTTEAAAVTAEGVGRTASVWACAAIGQTAIPVPVVGALVGGIVGQYGAAMIVQGLQLALVARDTAREWDRAYDLLVEQVDLIETECDKERDELAKVADAYDVGFTHHVLPALDRLADQFWTGDPDAVLTDLADLARRFDGTPQFSTLAEFDAFMGDPLSSLVLDLGVPRS